MGRDLPRREIEHQTEAKDLFEKKEAEIKPHGFQNSTRWSGTIGQPLPHDHPNLSKYSAQFREKVEDLKNIAKVGAPGGRAALARWKRTERARGDLAGLWNDVKLELGSRPFTSANPETAKRSNTALDLLEVAEQRGGLGTRLDQWNELVSSQMYSWDLLAETAGEIKQGIEFCKEMVDQGFGDISGLGNEAQINRKDLIDALEAIASEIAREADEILSDSRGFSLNHPPSKFIDAILERFRDVSPRTGITERLHDAFEDATVAQNWVEGLPASMHMQNSATQDLSNSLAAWLDAAGGCRELAYDHAHQEEDEKEAAEKLEAAAGAIAESINSLTDYSSDTPPDQISMAHHLYIAMAKEIMARHQQLSKGLNSLEAREILMGKTNFGGLIRTAVDLEAAEPDESVYSSAHHWFSKGELGEFWRQEKVSVDKGLRSANPALADEFARTVGQDLQNLLVSWPTGGETSDTHAWEVTAMLRDLKQRSEGLLKSAPAQRDYVRSAIDAIADCIAEDLQNVRSGAHP
jgi:hypothetical protein